MIKYWRRAGRNISHCVIVGASSNCVELYKELTDDASSGYRVYGYFAEKPSDRYPETCKYLGKPEETIAWLKENTYINNLYCALPSIERDTIVPIIDYCENNLVKFYSLPNLHNYLHNRVYLYTIGNVPVLSLRNNPLNEIQNRFIKRSSERDSEQVYKESIRHCVLRTVPLYALPYNICHSGYNNQDYDARTDILQAEA